MKVLVAIDDSPASQAVLREVALRPWPESSCLEVIHVVEPAHLWTDSATSDEAMRQAAQLVERAATELCGHNLEASGVVLPGDAKRVILDRAGATRADFVFAGSHGASAVTRFLTGNVASALVRYAPCSVEIVRTREGKPPGVRKILLATDGSESSERAAQSIAERSWAEGTEVEVLSVVELTLGNTQAFLEPPLVDSGQFETQREAAMQRAQSGVASAVQILSQRFSKVSESISVLLNGPKTVIVEQAEQSGADLIVVGSHGHRGIERFLLGSVSEAVAFHANCSVEVIRG
ncbi:MAG TPA: universal stress protein [Bryobacteraceae bacterium]|jgi:nucleotide-binding universal stress UspA family protein